MRRRSMIAVCSLLG